MKRSLVLFACLVGGQLGVAQSMQLALAPADRSVRAGTDARMELLVLNRGDREAAFTAATTIPARLIAGGRTWSVQLVADDPTQAVVIAPAGFAARAYLCAIPAAVPSGPVVVEAQVHGFPAHGVIELESAAAPADGAAVKRPTTNLARARPAAAALRRTFADRLGAHEPIYFIYGTDAPAAKFQFSFKYKLLDFAGLAPQRMARTLQFAFTQRSLWDLNAVSSPFYDTSYMPEIIYEALAPEPEASDRWFTWLGFQAAFKHESNGRDGPLSRSVNLVYARPVFAFGRLDGWHLLVMPEVFTYVDNLEDNADLRDYRGYGKLNLVFGRNDGPSLLASAWAGDDFSRGTLQLDLTLPIRTRLLNFETYLLIQYFNGYGESLLSYRTRSRNLRGGISLVR